jgi:leader peptidase (prepilin peptidase)/N-methyltransferase
MEVAIPVAFGLIFGSFLNVVIHRLPLGKSIVRPRSGCPHCGVGIKFYDNIPVLSYIWLGGKCRHCGAKISFHYPLVEILTAFTFWLTFSTFHQDPLYACGVIVFLLILIALAFIDYFHMILPDELTLGGAAVFALYSFLNPMVPVFEAVGTALGASLFFVSLYFFYLKVRKIEGLGFGDVKLMILLGLFLGLKKLVIALLLSSVAGLLVGFFFIIFKKKNLKLALPFGTFLALGSYIAVFWGEIIFDFFQLIYR